MTLEAFEATSSQEVAFEDALDAMLKCCGCGWGVEKIELAIGNMANGVGIRWANWRLLGRMGGWDGGCANVGATWAAGGCGTGNADLL